ncbi:hypothetical protein KSP40_PGU003494 [Platanthera guangdongensis]|uniref:Zinc finger PHD-type domain-containing protein n=1 Tax=Platanthera guangdongensis TaxID=2320717 RepID=A0ABR2M6J4_9ASPA
MLFYAILSSSPQQESRKWSEWSGHLLLPGDLQAISTECIIRFRSPRETFNRTVREQSTHHLLAIPTADEIGEKDGEKKRAVELSRSGHGGKTQNLGFVSAPQIKFRKQIQPGGNGPCESYQQNPIGLPPSSMKGRSHRPLPSAPLEDWGDGQWTVDCSCGVNFDDGEEMVSCDECGVWVHTRCSRYVRGEVSFACHKCKASSKRSRSSIPSAAANNIAVVHDTEETEVAQLLVELPTKADQPPPAPPVGAPYRPPFRLWAHVPMDERVHVQGVPGGDPSLFRGLSSKIFTPDLWKCTGYVPKKFNFKYKEFPCWEEEERDKASRGADALFSLSKEIVQAAVEDERNHIR